MRKLLTLPFALTLAISAAYYSSSAYAESYLTGSVGSATTTGFAEDSTTLNFGAGARFGDFFALEVSYLDTGEFTASETYNDGQLDSSLKFTGLNVSLIGHLPLSDDLELYGKVGQYFWRTDINSYAHADNSSASLRLNDADLTYGGGVLMHLSKQLALKAEYQIIDFAADNDGAFGSTDIASVGFIFKL